MPKSLEFILILDNSRFNKALDGSLRKAKSIGKRMADGFDPAIQKMKQMRAAAANIGTIGLAAGLAGGAVALSKFNTFMQESVDLANEQQKAEAKLAAVLQATGGAAGFTATELNAYASELQSITTYGDEVTISAMAMLATFKQIKGTNFKRATAAAQDMATVMEQDLNSSIVQVGKALNDPIKGMSALSRVGVTFTEQQKQMITELQKSGDLMGAQNIILKELESQFGGAAAAIRQTFGGALVAAQNAFGDLQEEIGFTITKNQFFLEGIKLAEQQFISWTNAIKTNGPQVREYAKDTAITLLQMGEAGLTALDFIYRGSQGVAGIFQRTAAFALDLSGGIFKIIQAGAALTDFLGITTAATEEWALQAEAAFGAADELKAKAAENFDQMADGSPKIQKAREALEQFRTEMEKVPADAVGDIKKEAEGVNKTTTALTVSTKDYTEKLELVNGVWKQQKKDVDEVGKSVDKVIAKVDRLNSKIGSAQSKSSGGSIGVGMATGGAVAFRNMLPGGFFPGFGGGDRRHVIAEDGEYMFDKYRVKDAGLDVVRDFHYGRYGRVVAALLGKVGQKMHHGGSVGQISIPPLPQFMADGGPVGAVVGGTSRGASTYNITVNYQGDGSAPSRQHAKNLTRMLFDEIKRVGDSLS